MIGVLNKKISPFWGILIILIIAGSVGATIFYYTRKISQEVLILKLKPNNEIIEPLPEVPSR